MHGIHACSYSIGSLTKIRITSSKHDYLWHTSLPAANVTLISIKAVRELFDGCIIRRGHLPPHSPELTHCDFYLAGKIER